MASSLVRTTDVAVPRGLSPGRLVGLPGAGAGRRAPSVGTMTSTGTHAPTLTRPPALRRRASVHRQGGTVPRAGLVALVAAPVVWLVAWTLMRVDGTTGPGGGWTSAHVAFLVSSLAYAVAAVVLGRIASGGRVPPPAVRVVVAVATLAA